MYKQFVDPDSTNSGGYERRPRGTKKSDETNEYSKPSNPSVIDDNHLEKPCKACVDFKDWLKHGVTTDIERKPTRSCIMVITPYNGCLLSNSTKQ
jgi:hypothetical protein